jgi:hypothetical protein
MSPSIQLLAFADLLATAHLFALGSTYEKQDELIAHCRAQRRAFLASMPVRHRFHCAECGVETTEVELHFEDPKQPLSVPTSQGMWGQPSGRYFATDLSSLHRMFQHSEMLPEEFAALLASAKP